MSLEPRSYLCFWRDMPFEIIIAHRDPRTHRDRLGGDGCLDVPETVNQLFQLATAYSVLSVSSTSFVQCLSLLCQSTGSTLGMYSCDSWLSPNKLPHQRNPILTERYLPTWNIMPLSAENPACLLPPLGNWESAERYWKKKNVLRNWLGEDVCYTMLWSGISNEVDMWDYYYNSSIKTTATVT